MLNPLELIKGGTYVDVRGSLRYINDFKFTDVKRFYLISHNDISIVRAWQAHKTEHKYFYVVKGAFLLAAVAIDDWQSPSKTLSPSFYTLSDQESLMLSIPGGYANGLKALLPDSTIMVFSSHTVEESSLDRWSFDKDLWVDWYHVG